MLKKFSRSFERKRDGKTPVKFRFDVHVVKVTGAFASNAALRVLWTRGSKVQMTQGVAVQSGAAHFERALSQVATLYRDVRHNFDAKVILERLPWDITVWHRSIRLSFRQWDQITLQKRQQWVEGHWIWLSLQLWGIQNGRWSFH